MNPGTPDAKRAHKSLWWRIAGLWFALLLVGGLILLALAPRDRFFHGKRESQWITNIVHGMHVSEDQNKEQVQRWHSLGPEGLRVLERGLATRRGQAYQPIYGILDKALPNFLIRILPAPPPKTVGGTRLAVMDLLCRMGTNAHAAWPAVARALADEDPWVRARAISFFTRPENDEAFLNQMSPQDKKALLPEFIRALETPGTDGWLLRYNGALALKYYREQAPLVTPALIPALKDPFPMVRLRAAEALNRVDPAAGSKAGAVNVVAELLKSPDYQISSDAAFVLRQFQRDADAAVTALIEALHGTNRTVVGASVVWSLQWAFPSQTNRTIPELRKAAELQDNAGGYARSAVKFLESNPIIKR